MTPDDERELIRATYGGVFEDPCWTTLLGRVRRLAGADYVSFAFQHADTPNAAARVVYSADQAPSPEPKDLAAPSRQAFQPFRSLEPGRVYALDDFLEPDNAVHAACRAYLSARGFNYNRVVRVSEPSGGSGWLGISRGGRDFAPDVRAMLEAIAPHLSTAVRMLAALEQERVRSDILADAVRRLNFGWLTFDVRGRVVETSPEAADIFRRTIGRISLEKGKPPRLAERARTALKATLAGFSTASSTRPRAIHLLDDPWLDMLLVHTPVNTVSGGATPIATAYIHGETVPSADRHAQLKELFALTDSEARVAIALSRGATLAEAAGQLNITVQTARYYSKRIYAKTGTRNQAGLVRIILGGVIALA